MLTVHSVLLMYHSGFCQNSNEENLWLSFQLTNRVTNSINLTSDLGFRTYDNFTRKNRTFLTRIMGEYQLSEKNQLGMGYANFHHFTTNTQANPEHRLFMQYRYTHLTNKLNFQARFRNEWRYFLSNRLLTNRSRIQFALRYNLSNSKISPVASIESFLSLGKSISYENRYILGTLISITPYLNWYIFYSLQKVSNSTTNQHILGNQIQLTF